VLWKTRDSFPSLAQIANISELMLTLASGLACAHLMTLEREEGFDEIRRTYAEPSWRMPLTRTLEAVAFIGISGLLAALFFALAYGQYNFTKVMLPAFAPALYLAGLALLANNISGSYWIAAGVTLAYWYGEWTSQGLHTGVLYLFQHSAPVRDIDLGLNRLLLVIGGLVFFALNSAYSAWRRRGHVER
jgi:hypothetical protein